MVGLSIQICYQTVHLTDLLPYIMKFFWEELSLQDFGTRLAQRIENNRLWSTKDFHSIPHKAIEFYERDPSSETADILLFTYGLTQDEGLWEYLRDLSRIPESMVDLESQSRIFEREFYHAKNLLGEEIYVFQDQEWNYVSAFGWALRENIDLKKSFSDLHWRGQVSVLVNGIMSDFATGENVFSSFENPRQEDANGYPVAWDKYRFSQWWDLWFLEWADQWDFDWDGGWYDFQHIDFSSSRSNFFTPMKNRDGSIVFVNAWGEERLEDMNIQDFQTRLGYTFFEDTDEWKTRTLRPVSDGDEMFIVGIDGITYFRWMWLSDIGWDTYNLWERNYHIDNPQEFINARKWEYAVLVNYTGEILFEDLQLDSISDAMNSEGEKYYIASKWEREFLVSESGNMVFDTGEKLSFNSWMPSFTHEGVVYLVAYDSQNRAMLVWTNGKKWDRTTEAYSWPWDFHEWWDYQFHYVENSDHDHQWRSGMIVLWWYDYIPWDDLDHTGEETLHIHL